MWGSKKARQDAWLSIRPFAPLSDPSIYGWTDEDLRNCGLFSCAVSGRTKKTAAKQNSTERWLLNEVQGLPLDEMDGARNVRVFFSMWRLRDSFLES